MRRITWLVFLEALVVIGVLMGCKPDEPRVSPNQSPLLSPLPTPVALPSPRATRYPTIMAELVILPTPIATPGPWIRVTSSGGYTGPVAPTVAPGREIPLTPGPSPTLPPRVQPFGTNGVLVNLQSGSAPVSVHVGQQLFVKEPTVSLAAEGWDVTYDATVLELGTNINLSRPPAIGWTWTIRQSGTTVITFQTKVPPCVSPPACLEMPYWRTTLTLQILP